MSPTVLDRLMSALPNVFLGALAFTSVATILIAGHIWRFPTPIVVLLDATFIFTTFAAFGIIFALASFVARIVSWILTSVCREDYFLRTGNRTALNILRASIGAISALSGGAFFASKYLGMGANVTNATVAISLGVLLLVLWSTLSRKVSEIKESTNGPETKFVALISSGQIRGLAILVLIPSFFIGELRMSHLITNEQVQLRRPVNTVFSNEVVSIVGTTANGIVVADYEGLYLQNRKRIVVRFVPYSQIGEIQGFSDTENTFISAVGLAAKGVLRVIDGIE